MKRAVVDANVFVSVILGGVISETLYKDLKAGKFKLILSQKMLDELLHVISRPKFTFDQSHCDDVLNFLKSRAEVVEPLEKVSLCRDPKDNMVLECALAGKADFIVTGDKDLLALKKFKAIRILTPQQFIKRLKK